MNAEGSKQAAIPPPKGRRSAPPVAQAEAQCDRNGHGGARPGPELGAVPDREELPRNSLGQIAQTRINWFSAIRSRGVMPRSGAQRAAQVTSRPKIAVRTSTQTSHGERERRNERDRLAFAILLSRFSHAVEHPCRDGASDPDRESPRPSQPSRARTIQNRATSWRSIFRPSARPDRWPWRRYASWRPTHTSPSRFRCQPRRHRSVFGCRLPSHYKQSTSHCHPGDELTNGENTVEIRFARRLSAQSQPRVLYTIFVPARAHECFRASISPT